MVRSLRGGLNSHTEHLVSVLLALGAGGQNTRKLQLL